MGKHKCCDCPEPVPADTCADLVSGNPPSRCNWWPAAYDVTVNLNGYALYRHYVGKTGSCNFGNEYSCPQTGAPALLSPGTQWLCVELEWSWSMTTRIYRMIPAPFDPYLECADQVICDPDENCGPPNSRSYCDEPQVGVSQGIAYVSACCGDARPIATGTLQRTLKSTTGYGFFSLGNFVCVVNQATSADTVSFSKDVHVVASCGVRQFGGVAVKLDIVQKDSLGCPFAGWNVGISPNALAWFDSVASSINGTSFSGSPNYSGQLGIGYNAVPIFGYGGNIPSTRWQRSLSFASGQLFANRPGEVGELEQLGIPGGGTGCDATALSSQDGVDLVWLGGDSCRPGGTGDFGRWTADATMTPVEGSI